MGFYVFTAFAPVPVVDDLCPEEGKCFTQCHRCAFRGHGIRLPSFLLLQLPSAF